MSWWPGTEAVLSEDGSRYDIAGVLLLTERLLIFASLETEAFWAMPLDRVVEVQTTEIQGEPYLFLNADHPTDPTLGIVSANCVGLFGARSEPAFVSFQRHFMSQLSRRLVEHSAAERWPSDGSLGIGTGWVAGVTNLGVDPKHAIAEAVGPHRLKPKPET